MGDVRSKVKQSPPVVEFALTKEHGSKQPRRRWMSLVTGVKGDRATFSRSMTSAVVKACADGAR